MMTRKLLCTVLYALAAILLAISLYLKTKNEDTDILFWLGVLSFAGAMIIQYLDKQKNT